MKISEVSEKLDISIDTLRYYEKIKLLNKVHRNSSGIRDYQPEDLKRIVFIKQAQLVGFSLDEIAQLLKFRDNPAKAKPLVRELVAQKLAELETRIQELSMLHEEFTGLIEKCVKSDGDCPILNQFENHKALK